MGCLKCGKETEEKQVFCDGCRLEMDKYPIKPGTPVQLQPREHKLTEKKGQKRKEQDPTITIIQLRRLIRMLTVTVAMMTLVICLLTGMLIHSLSEQTTAGDIGRNYTTDTISQTDR